MEHRERLPPHLLAASLAFGLFGLVVYGGYVVLTDEVPAWVGIVQLLLVGALLASVVVELKRNPRIFGAARILMIVAGAILLVAVVSLAVAALS